MEKLTIDEYLDKEKNIEDFFLRFLDNEKDSEENYQNFINYLKDQKISEDQLEIKIFLHMLTKISKYHYRTPSFFSKIERTILYFREKIKQTWSNSEIFDIFKRNKRIILFLINEKILNIDKSIVSKMKSKKYQIEGYLDYFYPEVLPFLDRITRRSVDEKNRDISNNFEQKRMMGENENQICQLIRSDSIKEFISYLNENSLLTTSKIKSSVFETNTFLLKNKSRLIEYAAFFGSFKIFEYLMSHNSELNPMLWLFAIHGQNMNIIHLLEKSSIALTEQSHKECLKEAIKCHCNEIADYLRSNVATISDFYSNGLRYNNYHYFPNKITSAEIFYDLCQFNYATIVSNALNDMEFDANSKIILKSFYIIKFQLIILNRILKNKF